MYMESNNKQTQAQAQAKIQAKYEAYQQVVRRMKSVITALENGDICELVEHSNEDIKRFEVYYLRAIQAKMEWQDAAMDARIQN